MRVFDEYSFNIADRVKFKDTKKYLDDMLADLGLNYSSVLFTFRPFLTDLDKITDKYPNLEQYQYIDPFMNGKKFLTSLTPQWADGEIYAAQEDWDAIFSVVSKIPREFNITPTLVPDQIDWYGEGTRQSWIGGHGNRNWTVFAPVSAWGYGYLL